MMVSTIKSLPLNVTAVRGESATSLASRIARKNGTANLQAFCVDMGIAYGALKAGDSKEIERLAALARCDPAALCNSTPRALSTTKYRLGSETLKFTAFRRTTVRGCPRCVAEAKARQGHYGPFQLGVWQLTSIRTCAKHRCMLVEVPPPQHHKHSFDFARLVDDMNLQDIEAVPERAQSLERYLCERLGRSSKKSWLDKLEFHVASQFCENFGLLLTGGPKARRTETTERQWLEAGAAGHEVLRHGPNRMLATLEDLRRKAGAGCHPHGAILGTFLAWLTVRSSDAAFEPVRRIVRTYVLDTFPVSAGSVVLNKRCETQQVYSLKTGAKAFGIDQRMLRHKLLERGDIKKPATSGPLIYLRYPTRGTLLQIVAETQDTIRGFDAAEYLGVEIGLLRSLVQQGFVAKAGEMARNAPYFRKKELDTFLDRLRGRASPGTNPNGDEISIIAATAACQCSTQELLNLIFEHNIPLYLTPGKELKFNSFQVSLERAKSAIGLSAPGAISLIEAAKRLGLNTATVRNLILEGYLIEATKTKKSAERWQVVDVSSVTKFSDRYVSAVHLASDLGRDTANLCSELYKEGIEPLILNGRNRIIFRRRDIS